MLIPYIDLMVSPRMPWRRHKRVHGNMTDIMAVIGLIQLERYEGLLNGRKEIIEMYDAAPHAADR
jgi:dTDP-4-amino-4,6-dideoxygalactose transaminase